jgi:hypothetical protein
MLSAEEKKTRAVHRKQDAKARGQARGKAGRAKYLASAINNDINDTAAAHLDVDGTIHGHVLPAKRFGKLAHHGVKSRGIRQWSNVPIIVVVHSKDGSLLKI